MKFNERYHKGINLGGWFSQCDYSKERLDKFITEKDFEKISQWGFDHVRLPVDFNIFTDKNNNFIDDGFNRVDSALSLCKKYNLNVILDLHKTWGFSFDKYHNESGFFEDEKYQDFFYLLWEKLAERYSSLSNYVAFELLNEVTNKEYMPTWNKIVKNCITKIRKFAPDTFILVGGYNNNDAKAVPSLEKPYDDKVIYNMHCYEPLKFTHQGADWTDAINQDDRFTFEEINIAKDYFYDLFKEACKAAEENNTSLYCGEYGIIDIVPPAEALKWIKTINAVFEDLNIGRCLWNYKELDFGFSDSRMDSYRDEFLKYV